MPTEPAAALPCGWARWLRGRWLAGLLLVTGLLWAAAASAQSVAVDVPQLQLERADDGVYLSATVEFELPALVKDALEKGIPVFFVTEADVLRRRWYWTDERIAESTRYMRLAYQPLTRRWRLNVSPNPFGNIGLGVSLSQNFDGLDDALFALKRVNRWRIAEQAQLADDQSYRVDFQFRLDTSQLPRPLQMGILGRADWSLSVDRSLPLGPGTEK